ncbi:MAG: tripartite tricarboxylate transporter TctB family protein [Candidatus Binatia bacterium]
MKANLTLFFLIVLAAAIVIGWDWPNIAKIMPVYVAAIPGLVLVLVQLYRDATAWEQRGSRASGGMDMDEVREVTLDKKTELRRTTAFFAWFIGGALGIWLLGLVIALPLLVFLYTWIEGKEKWFTALIATACTYALVWGLFEYMLETRWPPGILFGR